MCVYAYIYVILHTYMFIYMYIHTYIYIYMFSLRYSPRDCLLLAADDFVVANTELPRLCRELACTRYCFTSKL